MAVFKAGRLADEEGDRDKGRQVSPANAERRLNVRLLPFLVAYFGLLYALTGYRGWLIFFAGTGGAWLLAWLWVFSLAKSLQIERRIHLAWATAGESIPEQLKLTNHSWLPAVWVEISDVSSNLITPLRLVSDVSARSTRTRHFNHLFTRRGFYSLGPTRLRSGDPFGIYTLTLHDPHASTILITPPVLPLAGLKIAPGGWAGDTYRRQGALAREISDLGLRDYLPGDSLRRIHWQASAHHNNLIVRQLEAAASGDWWIFVDLQADVQAGHASDSTLELAIVLAASLVARGLKEHRRVGLALAGPQLAWLEPRAGPAAQWQMLRALAMAEAGQHSLVDLLRLAPASQAAVQVVITATTDPAWVATAGGRRRAGNLVALLIDPAEFGWRGERQKLVTALAENRIAYNLIPRSFLDQAYASIVRGGQRTPGSGRSPHRYLRQEKADWHSMA